VSLAGTPDYLESQKVEMVPLTAACLQPWTRFENQHFDKNTNPGQPTCKHKQTQMLITWFLTYSNPCWIKQHIVAKITKYTKCLNNNNGEQTL
jgi:hypothetical protein